MHIRLFTDDAILIAMIAIVPPRTAVNTPSDVTVAISGSICPLAREPEEGVT
ncbi:hypothetical protein L1D61_25905 [Vibrio mediterranei]|uniref:hypothetical protein n=1 Tax=Vibrio mediterranei TaxID=689 RepID=UPI0013DE3796|nr:hypothetical protein [Vibrio mediterranei]MCG9790568.1 hypothetical protein [Vibrio mediterranei]